MALLRFRRLERTLGLFDVFVISTAAMISSGFFLLPGIAAAYAGPAVVLAYLLAGVLVMPAMLSMAELATAMPRAGGAYYFLDRTLGPLVGTIGGVGTWLTLMLKSAFALIGMGAYVALVMNVPIVPAAIGFTALFAGLNIVGARESSGLLRVLVLALLTILAFFIVTGLSHARGDGLFPADRFTPFAPNGVDGVLASVGLVFVAYVGLTKIVSLAEEIRNPERNIPFGVGLGLLTVTAVYVIGVYVMVTSLGTDRLSASLTPAADAAQAIAGWLPPRTAVWLMAIAATVGLAASANAGILAASRYPLAMARDKVFPDTFAATTRSGTPALSIVFSCGVLVLFLLVLDVVQVAKLASALQLLLFGLINVAVIVMRESHIESYDPGFRSPLYPWVQLLGLIVPLVLVAEMGWLPVLFSIGVVAVCFGWYTYYGSRRIQREGALYHVFERLGRRRFQGLDRELRDIMKEKGARAGDPFDQVVARALVSDLANPVSLDQLARLASARLAGRLPATAAELETHFTRGIRGGATPVAHGVALLHARLPGLEASELLLVRCRGAVAPGEGDEAVPELNREAVLHPIQAVFFLVSGQSDPGRHLRILAQLAGRVEDERFLPQWLAGANEAELKEVLLRDERFLTVRVRAEGNAAQLIGRALRELEMPQGSLVALIQREGESIVPRGQTVLREGDRLTIIGDPDGIRMLDEQWGESL